MANKTNPSTMANVRATLSRKPVQWAAFAALGAFIGFGGEFGATPTFATLQREAGMQAAQSAAAKARLNCTKIVTSEVHDKAGAVISTEAHEEDVPCKSQSAYEPSPATSLAVGIVRLGVSFLSEL
jgi:hypothetical protein